MRSARKGCCGVVCAIGMLLVLVVAVFFVYGLRMIRKDVPDTKLPKPNAYDYYVQASGAIVDPLKVCAAAEVKTTPINARFSEERVYSLSEKEAILRENSTALALFDKAMSYRFMLPAPAIKTDATQMGNSGLTDLARLKLLSSQVNIAHNNWNGAMNDYLDTVFMGQQMVNGCGCIASLTGLRVQGIGRRNIYGAAEKLTSNELKSAIHRMEAINAMCVPYSDVLKREKLGFMSDLQKSAAGNGVDDKPSMKLVFGVTDMVMADVVDKCIPVVERPYAARPSSIGVGLYGRVLPSVSTEFQNTLLRGWFMHLYRNETQNNLFTVSLALRAYRLENGAYPKSLDQLVPAYLKQLPVDPFAMNGPLKYRKKGDVCTLYSIGPDGKDDGGQAVADTSKAEAQIYRVMENSRGDIVAGLNT